MTPGVCRTVSISASGSPPDWSVTSMSGTQSPGLNGWSIEYPQIIIETYSPRPILMASVVPSVRHKLLLSWARNSRGSSPRPGRATARSPLPWQ